MTAVHIEKGDSLREEALPLLFQTFGTPLDCFV